MKAIPSGAPPQFFLLSISLGTFLFFLVFLPDRGRASEGKISYIWDQGEGESLMTTTWVYFPFSFSLPLLFVWSTPRPLLSSKSGQWHHVYSHTASPSLFFLFIPKILFFFSFHSIEWWNGVGFLVAQLDRLLSNRIKCRGKKKCGILPWISNWWWNSEVCEKQKLYFIHHQSIPNSGTNTPQEPLF